MLRIFARRAGYCDQFGYLRVDKGSVTALAAAIYNPCPFKVRNKISYFRRHSIHISYVSCMLAGFVDHASTGVRR